jgi:hypothetical protein
MQIGREYTNIRYSSDIGSTLSSSATSGLGSMTSLSSRSSTSAHFPVSSPNSVILRGEAKKPPRAVSEIPLPR